MKPEVEPEENAAKAAWPGLVLLANDTMLGKYPGKKIVFAPGGKVMFASDVTSVPSVITLYMTCDWRPSRPGPGGRQISREIALEDVARIVVFARRAS